MASQDGKIVFENTLDARLEVVFRKKLPEVCTMFLFIWPCHFLSDPVECPLHG